MVDFGLVALFCNVAKLNGVEYIKGFDYLLDKGHVCVVYVVKALEKDAEERDYYQDDEEPCLNELFG